MKMLKRETKARMRKAIWRKIWKPNEEKRKRYRRNGTFNHRRESIKNDEEQEKEKSQRVRSQQSPLVIGKSP